MKMIIVEQCCNRRQNFMLYFGYYSILEMPLPMELVEAPCIVNLYPFVL
jgi:hypothetical protein